MNTSLTQNGNCCTPSATRTETSATTTLTARPRVNIYENDKAFLLDVELPGVAEQDADVVLEKNMLTIKGTTQPASREGYQRVYGFGRQITYQRSFQLPDGIDREGLTATLKDGVLSVVLPKAAALQPQKVVIKAG